MEKVKEIISKHKKLGSHSIPITDVLEIISLMQEYKKEQLILSGVSNFKTEPKLGKLETELGKLQKLHGDIVKYFDVHSGCDSFKFKDGAVYRVKLERSFGKATLD